MNMFLTHIHRAAIFLLDEPQCDVFLSLVGRFDDHQAGILPVCFSSSPSASTAAGDGAVVQIAVHTPD